MKASDDEASQESVALTEDTTKKFTGGKKPLTLERIKVRKEGDRFKVFKARDKHFQSAQWQMHNFYPLVVNSQKL